MKVVILAGGLGTRLSELTKVTPKPMVRIGKYPILIYILKHYSNYGFKDFILATGYKKEIFAQYFKNFEKFGRQFKSKIFKTNCNITILNTGNYTMTGGRLKRTLKFILPDKDFMFTYGDGISNVNINKLYKYHKKKNKTVTVTAVRPPARFGEIIIKKNIVKSFKEKPQVTNGWINGGYFVAKTGFLKFIKGDKDILEKKPLEKVCKKKQLSAFKHEGFWKCMDVKRDKDELEKIYRKTKFKW